MVSRTALPSKRTGSIKLSLAARMILGAGILVAVSATAFVWLVVKTDRAAYLADRGAALENRVQRAATQFSNNIDSLRRQVLVLTKLPPVQGIARASLNGGVDPEMKLPINFWEARLQETFASVAEGNPDYFQIRYIGLAAGGRELVRVNMVDGRTVATPPEELQAKGDRDYFQATLKLQPGEVYISDINLNRESGEIQVPHTRTLRAATPVFTRNGELFGMVVINADAGPLIDAITTNLAPGVLGYLMNGDGDYLAHPDPKRAFGFDLGRRYRWQDDMPGLQMPSTQDGANHILQRIDAPDGLLHVAVGSVSLDPRAPDRSLLVAYALPDSMVKARLADVRNTTAGGITIIAVLLLGSAVLLVRRAFAPLTRLAASAEAIGKGRYDVTLPDASSGEMGAFVRAFDEMLKRIAQREEALHQASAELQNSESRLRTIVENLAEGVAVSDLDGRLLHFNQAAVRMHGFAEPGEYLRFLPEFTDMFDLSAPDGTLCSLDQWPLSRILKGETLHELEVQIRNKRVGWQRVFSYGGTLVRDAVGHPLMAVVTMRDVTERRRADARIRAQLEHLNLLDHITRATGERQDLRSIFQVVVRSLEDSLPIDFGCVCLYDLTANALTMNSVGAKSEALAHDLMMEAGSSIDVDENGLSRCVQGQLVYEPDILESAYPFPQRLARGGLRSVVMAPLKSESRVFGVLVTARRGAAGFSSIECEFLRQLSEHVALSANQAQLYGALQRAYDDLRQTQQTMMQEERLRALGQMASGIAHDINNALSPVSLYAESMLETEQGLSERARGNLQVIRRAVDDVAETVARMREFYRPREIQLRLTPVQLNTMVEHVLKLTSARWNDQALQRGITIRVLAELSPDVPTIMGVESEIREALTNLVFNAVDAMPEGGTLTLRTRDAADTFETAAVVLEVTDTGIGMDEETRRRCLEPFFTTKGERGTGLGLAMVFGMAQRHSAELEIESTPGVGTTARLIFAVSTAIREAEADGLAARIEASTRLRLLLIDDDPLLLKSLRDALESIGHVVVTANGGEAGIQAFREACARGERFAAVITDLGMPNVDGRRVAAAIKKEASTMPVILLTGWGRRLEAEGDIPPHVDLILAKPPKLREIREALARLCDVTESGTTT